MKKGISLIVLVITIIVLAILAGAIIISLSNTNVIQQATEAKNSADRANAKYAVSLIYAAAVAKGNDGKAYVSETGTALMTAELYRAELVNQGYTAKFAEDLVKAVDGNGAPVVATN